MAGRPLRRQRLEALKTLPLETKQELARKALAGLNDSQLIAFAAANLCKTPAQTLRTMDDARAVLHQAITDNSDLLDPIIFTRPSVLKPHLT